MRRETTMARDAAILVAEGRAGDLAAQYVSALAPRLARMAASALLDELVDGGVETEHAASLVAAVPEEVLARLIGTPIRQQPRLTLVHQKPRPKAP